MTDKTAWNPNMDEAPCPECNGAGSFECMNCCGGSSWECGGRGCTGPVPDGWFCHVCNGNGFIQPQPPEDV